MLNLIVSCTGEDAGEGFEGEGGPGEERGGGAGAGCGRRQQHQVRRSCRPHRSKRASLHCSGVPAGPPEPLYSPPCRKLVGRHGPVAGMSRLGRALPECASAGSHVPGALRAQRGVQHLLRGLRVGGGGAAAALRAQVPPGVRRPVVPVVHRLLPARGLPGVQRAHPVAGPWAG